MVKYQGNKSKYSSNIVNKIRERSLESQPAYDICCGAGEVTAHWSRPVTMIDSGPWGFFWRGIKQWQVEEAVGYDGDHTEWSSPLVWSEIYAENYDFNIKLAVKREAPTKGSYKWCALFLALQHEAFNGKAVECTGGLWKHPGFGRYFSRKFYLNSMKRACSLQIASAHVLDANDYVVPEVATVYVDPDYEETLGYGNRTLDVRGFLGNNRHCDLFVSHHTVLTGVDWTDIFNVSVARAGREGRTAKDETELLHYLKKETA